MSNQNNESNSHLQPLSVFCNKYEPATKENMTAMFSTMEIQKIIKDHTGSDISLQEISDLLTQMHYTYELDDNNFMWLVRASL